MLIGAMATHIGDERRLQLLKRCLRSIRDQTTFEDFTHMFISWSASAGLSDRTRDVLSKFKSDMLQTEVVLLPSEERRLQQFQHYERIKDRMFDMSNFGDRTYIMFSDDDDIWDSRRVGEAMKILRVMDSSQSCCMRYASNMHNQRGYALGKNPLARDAIHW